MTSFQQQEHLDTATMLAEIGALAADLSNREADHLMRFGTLADNPYKELAEQLSRMIGVALEQGATLDHVHNAILPNLPYAGSPARQRMAGLLAADAAQLAFVEEHLIAQSQGEVPVAHVSRLRVVLTTARREFDTSVRRALARGLSPDEIVGIAEDAGIEFAHVDVVLAFEEAASRG